MATLHVAAGRVVGKKLSWAGWQRNGNVCNSPSRQAIRAKGRRLPDTLILAEPSPVDLETCARMKAALQQADQFALTSRRGLCKYSIQQSFRRVDGTVLCS